MANYCKPGCVLDCPYCHRHVVDTYSHLKFTPCEAAARARDDQDSA